MLVAAGGALGALLRYFLTNLSKLLFETSIFGTLSVNILGSFLIGYFVTSKIGSNLSPNFIKFFLTIGLLGSFTTFSAFTKEVLLFSTTNGIVMAYLIALIITSICLLSTFIGYKIFA